MQPLFVHSFGEFLFQARQTGEEPRLSWRDFLRGNAGFPLAVLVVGAAVSYWSWLVWSEDFTDGRLRPDALLLIPVIPLAILLIWCWRTHLRLARWRRLFAEGRLFHATVVAVTPMNRCRRNAARGCHLLRLEFHCAEPEPWRGTADYWVDTETFHTRRPPVGTPLHVLHCRENDYEVL